MRDEYGNVESDIYNSIHLVLENIINKNYNCDKELKKFSNFLLEEDIEEMKKKYNGDERYMRMLDKVEKLSEDPDFLLYYDLDEKHKEELEDMKLTGIHEGIEQGTQETRVEVVKNMYKDNISIEKISKYTNLPEDEIKLILNDK